MKKNLLNILCCPFDKQKLELINPEYARDEIKSGILKCQKCDREYNIINYIPVMLTEEKPFQDSDTVKGWSFQWRNENFLKDTKYYSEELLDLEYKEWHLPNNWLNDKKVLDVGCGNGRHSLIINKYNVKECVAFDLSESVYYMLHKPEFEGIHLVRADMLNPPFPDEYFDFVLARQVLQHTREPAKAIKSLSRLLRKDGYFVSSLYKTPEKFLTLFKLKLIAVIRKGLSIFPDKFIYYFTWLSVPLYKYKIFYPLARLLFIQSEYDKSDSNTWALNHDQYINSYQYTFSRDKMIRFLNEAGLTDHIESKEWDNLFRSTKK